MPEYCQEILVMGNLAKNSWMRHQAKVPSGGSGYALPSLNCRELFLFHSILLLALIMKRL